MPDHFPNLIGEWRKITTSTCSQLYPDHIQFKNHGQYLGGNDAPGTFTLWDAGTFEIVTQNTIKISTANDAVITYQFSLTGDRLQFIDSNDCQFEYRRSEGF